MSEYPIIPKDVDIFNKAYHSQKEDLYSKFYTIKDKVEGYKTSFTTGSLIATNINNTNTNTLISQVKNNKDTLTNLTSNLSTANTNLTNLVTNVTNNKNTLTNLTTNLSTTNTNLTNLITKVNDYITALATQQTTIDGVDGTVTSNDERLTALDALSTTIKRFLDVMLEPINNIPFVNLTAPW